MEQNNHSNYEASEIQVLEGLEAVKRRPGMYIGSTDVRGLHRLKALKHLYFAGFVV